MPDGEYEVTLHFAELLSANEREALIYNVGSKKNKENFTERMFDIFINGNFLQRLGNSNYLVPETAYQIKTFVTVKNGVGINIGFKAIKNQAILNGIEVSKM